MILQRGDMARPKAQTLQQRFGFMDGDFKQAKTRRDYALTE